MMISLRWKTVERAEVVLLNWALGPAAIFSAPLQSHSTWKSNIRFNNFVSIKK